MAVGPHTEKGTMRIGCSLASSSVYHVALADGYGVPARKNALNECLAVSSVRHGSLDTHANQTQIKPHRVLAVVLRCGVGATRNPRQLPVLPTLPPTTMAPEIMCRGPTSPLALTFPLDACCFMLVAGVKLALPIVGA